MDGQSGGRRGGRLDARPGVPRGGQPGGRPQRLDGRAAPGGGTQAAGSRGGGAPQAAGSRGGTAAGSGGGARGGRGGAQAGGPGGGGRSLGGVRGGGPGAGGPGGSRGGGAGRGPGGPGGPRGGGRDGVRHGGGGSRGLAGVLGAVRRLPHPRLTGLGGGLFATASMLLVGFLDWLLFDGSPFVYGLLFLPVSAATALWVRSADLVTAPISVPIAFAVGVMPIAGGEGGFGGHAMALVTALAVHAGWLYGGTLVAGLITCVRKVRLMGRRQRAATAAAARGPAAATAPRRP